MGSVLAMIDILIGDLDKEMTEAKLDEENGQKDYETMMSESAAKRTEVGKAAPGPPPETWDAYAKKSEGSSSVLAMIDILIGDLDKEMTEAKLDEENGQKDYETMMSE